MITGSSGILGKHICRLLKKKPDINVIKFQGDIMIQENVNNNFQSLESLDYVLHLAAMVSIKKVDSDAALACSTNISGTINLFNAFSKFKINPYFFYASSSHVYAKSDIPIKESFKIDPCSLYGKTKFIAESIAYEICKLNNQSFCSGRIFSFYDKKQAPPFLYGTLNKRLKEEDLNKPFVINHGESVRDFSTAEMIAQNIIDLSMKKRTGFFNIGSGIGIKVKDFAQSLTKKKLNIITDEFADSLIADVSKLSNLSKLIK